MQFLVVQICYWSVVNYSRMMSLKLCLVMKTMKINEIWKVCKQSQTHTYATCDMIKMYRFYDRENNICILGVNDWRWSQSCFITWKWVCGAFAKATSNYYAENGWMLYGDHHKIRVLIKGTFCAAYSLSEMCVDAAFFHFYPFKAMGKTKEWTWQPIKCRLESN